MSAILKRHCYHSNGNDVIFVNNFQLLEDCSIYVVQFLSSNKKRLFKKLNLNHNLLASWQLLTWSSSNLNSSVSCNGNICNKLFLKSSTFRFWRFFSVVGILVILVSRLMSLSHRQSLSYFKNCREPPLSFLHCG
jgi:hypothetical protein